MGDGGRRWWDAQRFISPGARRGRASEWLGRGARRISAAPQIADRRGSEASAPAGGPEPACSSPRAVCSGVAPGPAAAGPRLQGGRCRAQAWESAEPEMGTPSHPRTEGDRFAPRGAFHRLALALSPRSSPLPDSAARFLRAPNSPGPRAAGRRGFPGRLRSAGCGCESPGDGDGETRLSGPAHQGPPRAVPLPPITPALSPPSSSGRSCLLCPRWTEGTRPGLRYNWRPRWAST